METGHDPAFLKGLMLLSANRYPLGRNRREPCPTALNEAPLLAGKHGHLREIWPQNLLRRIWMSDNERSCPRAHPSAPVRVETARKPHVLAPGFWRDPVERTNGSAKPLRASRSGHCPERARSCRWGFSASRRMLGCCPAAGRAL